MKTYNSFRELNAKEHIAFPDKKHPSSTHIREFVVSDPKQALEFAKFFHPSLRDNERQQEHFLKTHSRMPFRLDATQWCTYDPINVPPFRKNVVYYSARSIGAMLRRMKIRYEYRHTEMMSI